MYINIEKLREALKSFKGAMPFDHCVIDDFFDIETAKQLEQEFLAYDNPKWFYYKNAIEDKKALNDWNAFPPLTYAVFSELISEKITDTLSESLGTKVFRDAGLHGGGWHIHGPGGNLNPHLDYSIHPKLGLQRKLNIIIYLSSTIEEQHGGHLGFWSHDEKTSGPGELKTSFSPKFNRAVLFDTTQNSWHGLSNPLIQPDGIYRKSFAVYYLIEPKGNVDTRQRALFAPREEQRTDESVQALIRTRADAQAFAKAYRTDTTI